MALPGTAAIPALDAPRGWRGRGDRPRRRWRSRRPARGPSAILTPAAFDNAITALMALGGSTNAVVHLLAHRRPRRRRAHARPLRRDRAPDAAAGQRAARAASTCSRTLHGAGGVPALLRELATAARPQRADRHGPHRSARDLEGVAAGDPSVIARATPRSARPAGSRVLRGSLAPDGALIKLSAASPALFRHRGRAVVFEDIHDARARASTTPTSRSTRHGPRAAQRRPGGRARHAGVGQLPIPAKLLRAGRRGHGAHLGRAHERHRLRHRRAARRARGGGRRAAGSLVRDGDPIVLDVEARRLDLDLPAGRARRARSRSWPPRRGRTAAATARSSCSTSCRPTRAATSTSCARSPGEPAETRAARHSCEGWIGGW